AATPLARLVPSAGGYPTRRTNHNGWVARPPHHQALDRPKRPARIARSFSDSGPPAHRGSMEFVFVAPREALFPACYPQGFHPFSERGSERGSESGGVRELLERVREHGFFVERSRAERTPAWKQLIP